jgi:hypothetical protein
MNFASDSFFQGSFFQNQRSSLGLTDTCNTPYYEGTLVWQMASDFLKP